MEEVNVSTEQWGQVSRILDFIMQQPTKAIKESPGAVGIRGEVEKPKRKPKKEGVST
jgi:hypothetical protein